MDEIDIQNKFGGDYSATEHTYVLGIDARITKQIAKRFRGHRVLETCTGAGFTTISLARECEYVCTIEIDKEHQSQARANIQIAGLLDKVTFILGDALSDESLASAPIFNAAFLDPDWAVTGPNHVYKFRNSNTQPPADELLNKVLGLTPNIVLIQPPYIDKSEFSDLPEHELQSIYLDNHHALFCLYFGDLMSMRGETKLNL